MNLFAGLVVVAVLSAIALSPEKIDWGIEVDSKPYTFAADVAEINKLDLANMKAVVVEKGKAAETIRLKRGKAKKEHRYKDNSFISATEVTLRWTKPLDAQHRVAYYDWGWYAGSSSQSGIVQVLEQNEGKVSLTQQIDCNQHGGWYLVGTDFRADSNTLIVKSVPWDSPGGRGSPSHLNTITFHWDGQSFVRVSATRKPFPEMHKTAEPPSSPDLLRSTPKTAP